jgi:hypothetical protein
MPTDQNFLDALSESLGVSLALREDLTCCLSTPDGLEIQIEYLPSQLPGEPGKVFNPLVRLG